MKIGPAIGHNYVDVLMSSASPTPGEASARRFIAMNHNASHDYKLRRLTSSCRRYCREWASRYVEKLDYDYGRSTAIGAARGNKGFNMRDSWMRRH